MCRTWWRPSPGRRGCSGEEVRTGGEGEDTPHCSVLRRIREAGGGEAALRRLLARFDSVSGAIMRQSGGRQEELLDPGERRLLSAARHALSR